MVSTLRLWSLFYATFLTLAFFFISCIEDEWRYPTYDGSGPECQHKCIYSKRKVLQNQAHCKKVLYSFWDGSSFFILTRQYVSQTVRGFLYLDSTLKIHAFKRHYTAKKSLSIFLSPAAMSLTKRSLARNTFNYSRPERVWLVKSQLGKKKIANLFLQCNLWLHIWEISTYRSTDMRSNEPTLRVRLKAARPRLGRSKSSSSAIFPVQAVQKSKKWRMRSSSK
jgi:hypothetical protein